MKMNGKTSLHSKFIFFYWRLSKFKLCYLMIMLLVIVKTVQSKTPSACEVFCKGKILHVVQTAGLYKDDKTFVDMKMKFPKSEVFFRFNWMMNDADGKPHKTLVRRFVRKCFHPPGSEFERCTPPDWTATPSVISNITDRHLKDWALDLNMLWKLLCRKMRQDVHDDPNSYTAIYVPNCFIVPGGRYTEYYYWDSYWIVLGLVRSNMYSTAKGIIENFLYLTEKYGFVPNGGRIYYLERSNFPLLIPMADIYYKATEDKQFITKHIATLEKEFKFWMENRVVEVSGGGKTVKLARYSATQTNGPRPDSYNDDLKVADSFETQKERDNFYWELKAACEAGWNFSSRWFRNKNDTGEFREIKTRSIVPVDLNAVLFLNAQILSEFFKIINNAAKAAAYKKISKTWMESVTKLLWSDEDGAWFDYDIRAKMLRKHFYISNLVPLWTGCYDNNKADEIAQKVVKYLKKNKIQNFEGGTPVSLWEIGNHWDFPNAIPSVQHMLIVGLENTNNDEAKHFAFELARHWVRANYIGFTMTNSMHDTYDATKPGMSGHDRLYGAQTGYGWTNGVILDLLQTYGKRISVRDLKSSASTLTPILRVIPFLFHTFLSLSINEF